MSCQNIPRAMHTMPVLEELSEPLPFSAQKHHTALRPATEGPQCSASLSLPVSSVLAHVLCTWSKHAATSGPLTTVSPCMDLFLQNTALTPCSSFCSSPFKCQPLFAPFPSQHSFSTAPAIGRLHCIPSLYFLSLLNVDFVCFVLWC